MPSEYTAVTKPNSGEPTKASTISTMIDNDAYLYGQVALAVPGVANGSMENDTDADDTPDNWEETTFTAGTVAQTSSDNIHGDQCVAFTHPGGASNGGGTLTMTDSFPVSPSMPLWVAWEMKCSGSGCLNKVEILWYQDDKTTASSTPTSTVWSSTAAPTSWTHIAGFGVPASDARWAKVRLTGGDDTTDPGASRTIYFDNVRAQQAYWPPQGYFKKVTEYTTAGTLAFRPASGHYNACVILVGAGGSGAGAAFGGGGETAMSNIEVDSGTTYTVAVGAGGATSNGGNSTWAGTTIVAVGGKAAGGAYAGGTGGTGDWLIDGTVGNSLTGHAAWGRAGTGEDSSVAGQSGAAVIYH